MKRKKQAKVNETTIIIGIILNLFFPGLGTIIFGKYDIGTIQLVLSLTGCLIFFASIPLVIALIGFLGMIIGMILYCSVWIWALVFGIKTLKEARE